MKRKVKRYAEGEMVEGDEIPMDMEPRRSIKDYMTNPAKETEGGYTSPVREYAREAKAPVRKRKRVPKYSDVVKASELGSQDFSSKKAPEKSRDMSAAALLAIPAAAAAAAGMRRNIRTGSRAGSRVEPTMSRVRTQEIDPFDQMAMDRMTGEGGRKKGGHIKAKKMASGGSASSRADGIAQRGKTRGRMC
jgi:hypothetical protein